MMIMAVVVVGGVVLRYSKDATYYSQYSFVITIRAKNGILITFVTSECPILLSKKLQIIAFLCFSKFTDIQE